MVHRTHFDSPLRPFRRLHSIIGLPHHDCACSLDTLNHGCVPLWDPVLEQQRPHGGPDAAGVLGVLDSNGQSVQWTKFVAPNQSGLGFLSRLDCRVVSPACLCG